MWQTKKKTHSSCKPSATCELSSTGKITFPPSPVYLRVKKITVPHLALCADSGIHPHFTQQAQTLQPACPHCKGDSALKDWTGINFAQHSGTNYLPEATAFQSFEGPRAHVERTIGRHNGFVEVVLWLPSSRSARKARHRCPRCTAKLPRGHLSKFLAKQSSLGKSWSD